MHRFLYFLLLFLLLLTRVASDGVPVAPLHPDVLENGETVFRLENDFFTVEIHPESGGVRSLRPRGGEELLAGKVLNLPVPEEVLLLARPQVDGETPPLWQARAWVTSESSKVVMLSQTFGEPANLRVTQIITLPDQRPEILLSSRVTAVAPPDVPPAPFSSVPLVDTGTEEAPAAFWMPVQSGETPECGEWIRTETLPEFRETDQLALQSPDHLLILSQEWRMEDGDALTPAMTAAVSEALPDEKPHYALRSAAGMPEDLPPQGWTLLQDLRLRLHPLGPDRDTVCDILTR